MAVKGMNDLARGTETILPAGDVGIRRLAREVRDE
jgi:hypothetical protein